MDRDLSKEENDERNRKVYIMAREVLEAAPKVLAGLNFIAQSSYDDSYLKLNRITVQVIEGLIKGSQEWIKIFGKKFEH